MKNAKSAGFRWLPSYYDATRWLPDAERLAMYDAILDYGFGNDVGELPPLLKGFFCLMMPSIEKSIRFEQEQKDNSAKGGRPKKAGKAIDENPEENPEETQNEIDENPDDNPEETQNDFDKNLAIAVDLAVAKDSAIESAIESAVESAVESEGCGGKKKRAARFTPPAFHGEERALRGREKSGDGALSLTHRLDRRQAQIAVSLGLPDGDTA